MSDHWNSLADLLGTPSIDPLQRKPNQTTKPAFEPPRDVTAPAKEPSMEAARPVSSSADTSRTAVRSADNPESVGLESLIDSPTKAETPSRLKSSWDAVARIFGMAPSTTEPAPISNDLTPSRSEAPKSSIAASGSATDADLFAGFNQPREAPRSEPRPPTRSESTRNDSASEAARRPKKRAASMWDSPDPLVEPDVSASSRPATEPSPRSSPETEGFARRPAASDSETPPRRSHHADRRGDRDSSNSSRGSERVSAESRDEVLPERSGRPRNIRRGRDAERSGESTRRREEVDVPPSSGERDRDETRGRRPDRAERGDGESTGRGRHRSEGRSEVRSEPRGEGRSSREERPSRDDRGSNEERSTREARTGRNESSRPTRRGDSDRESARLASGDAMNSVGSNPSAATSWRQRTQEATAGRSEDALKLSQPAKRVKPGRGVDADEDVAEGADALKVNQVNWSRRANWEVGKSTVGIPKRRTTRNPPAYGSLKSPPGSMPSRR